ncbi:GNAT superfamily N-acetyltransferase [Cryobacterium mesophilum]|uniref:GNAT family N-acetyltransferase n=1 Tax=Terrimesophilobacter mesophilus TaxID=433647 RepID=UPI00142571F7|nr:GNAT family N-acetyltransferase [Terrimesophilobacter mesophilus]MBB5632977.1 GNAT superfamily N-acetyltransferase [Terrimesophilobacter mesophilus]
MTTKIRRAVLADAEHIGPVHAQVWRETYRGILSDQWIANVSEEERVTRWRLILGELNPARQWVAEVDGMIVGFAASGPPRDAEPIRPLELWSIHLLRENSRAGIGTALVQAALGDAPASVWVVAANRPAQHFYRALGFFADGARDVLAFWENIPELRMTR